MLVALAEARFRVVSGEVAIGIFDSRKLRWPSMALIAARLWVGVRASSHDEVIQEGPRDMRFLHFFAESRFLFHLFAL